MIATLGEPDLPVLVPESFHEQTGEELTENDIKRMDADDQVIQTILLGLPEDVYAVVDSCETAKEIWEQNIAANLKFLNNLQPEWKRHVTIVRQTKNLHEADFTQIYDFLKMNQDEVNELRDKRLAKTHDPLVLMAHSQNSYNFSATRNDQTSFSTHSQQSFPISNKYNPQPSLNQNFMQPQMTSLEDINDPTKEINTTLILFAKAFQLIAPMNNNQRTSSNPCNRQIAQPGMNMSQDRQSQNIRGNGRNQFGQYNGGNQNGLVVVPGIANQNGTGNIVATRAEGDLDEIEEVNANCILMENLQHASTSGTQLDKAPVYDTDGSADVQLNDNCYDNEIFNMFTHEEHIMQSGGTVETSSAPNEETRAHQETVYRNLVDQVAQVNLVNCNMRATNAELKSELARYKIQEQHIEISQEKYDKISYDKAYNDMQQKVERLQAQLRDLKGKSSDTPSASNTLDPLNQKLESKIVEFEFQVINYEHEISHLKTTYKNLFDSITSNRAHAKLHNLIYENAKLRARLFENTFESMNNTSRTSVTPQVDKPKFTVVPPYSKKLHASIPSHSVPQPREFNVMKHGNVIAPGMFKIDLPQTFRVDMVPNKQSSASIRTNPITNFQRHVTFKENVSSNMVNESSTGLVHTAKTKSPQPKGNTRNDRVPSASKSTEFKKNVTVEDHRRILLLFKNQKAMSFECNNIKIAIRNDKSKIICGTCKQCLVTANHDACLLSLVNALISRANNLCANASPSANQRRHRTHVWKPKQVGFKERLSCKPRLPRFSLKWLPSGCSFDLKGKLVAFKETNCPNDDKSCTSNPHKPIRKRFPNSTVFLGRLSKFVYGTVRFRNDHIAAILGYGDLKWEILQSPGFTSLKKNTLDILGFIFLEQRMKRQNVGITHETSATKTPQQNRVVERTNRTLVEAARTMLIFSHALLFLWAEVIATTCKDIDRLGAKGDIVFFIGYSANSVAYRVYNQRTKKIIEMMNVTFDELSAMAFE
nr:hypothetical protein [Tanacetum cinerariifolium]